MTDARQILVDWANEQAGWVKLLVKEILDTGTTVPDNILDGIYNYFLIEKGLEQGETLSVNDLHFVEERDVTTEKFILKELTGVKNVNRLTTNQDIKFNQGVTVVFGENASGKSGYVRILKKLAGTRSEEEILPDVTKIVLPGNPQATISYAIGDKDASLNWNGEGGVVPFSRIGIFDNRALVSHVDEDLTYVYTPRELSQFKLTHTALELVRTRLDDAKKRIKPSSNPFLNKFNRDNNIYSKIETLGPTSDLKELEALSQVTAEEEATIEPLREQVEALSPQLISNKLESAESRLSILSHGMDLANIVKSFNWTGYNSQAVKLVDARERHSKATEKAFIGDNIDGILTESWKRFIEAGDNFLKETKSEEYPEKDDACIYCQQPLENAAIDLLKKYKAYCNDSLKKEVRQCEKEIRELSTVLNYSDLDLYIKTIERKLNNTQSQNKELLELKLTFALRYQDVLKKCVEMTEVDFGTLDDLANSVIEESSRLLASTKDLIAALKKQGEERKTALIATLPKLKNLEARKVLLGIFSEVKQFVENAKWASKAESILSTFQGLLRSLTTQTKLASEDLLNKDFQAFFAQESSFLKAPNVKLDFPGQRGEAARRKSLSTRYRLSDILSEGEQKVIALADFLAETSIRKTPSPIIFDDPVNSLDYKRMEYIVDRIYQLSTSQQIIVFTHNIWFATSLLSRFEAEAARCTYYDMAESNGVPGFVRSGTHPRWDTVNNLKGKINGMIQTAASLNGEAQQAFIERTYDVFRSWCEVVVEQELLCKVAQRYTPHIMMTALEKIKVSKLSAAIDVILPIFFKCCRFMPGHSQPLETLGIRATIEELKEDWKLAQEALKQYQI